MRCSARAILITKEGKFLLMKRQKKDTPTYYVTLGGGIEKKETKLFLLSASASASAEGTSSATT